MAIALSEGQFIDPSRRVAGLGFEPRFYPPEGHVLPLHHPALYSGLYQFLNSETNEEICGGLNQ